MATNAFHEFRNWHTDPGCSRVAVSCGWASGVMLLCLKCGCAAELEALGGRSTLLDSARVRAADNGAPALSLGVVA